MGLVRMGPLVLDMDDVRAMVDRGDGAGFEVTFRDASRMEFPEGPQAEALRRFLLNLPDGLPMLGANDAATGVVGRRANIAAVKRQEG